MYNSKPFSLNARDFGKGLLLAGITAFVGGFQQMLSGHGLDFPHYDWALILNLVVAAFVSYIGKQFVSDAHGTPFGSAHHQ